MNHTCKCTFLHTHTQVIQTLSHPLSLNPASRHAKHPFPRCYKLLLGHNSETQAQAFSVRSVLYIYADMKSQSGSDGEESRREKRVCNGVCLSECILMEQLLESQGSHCQQCETDHKDALKRL